MAKGWAPRGHAGGPSGPIRTGRMARAPGTVRDHRRWAAQGSLARDGQELLDRVPDRLAVGGQAGLDRAREALAEAEPLAADADEAYRAAAWPRIASAMSRACVDRQGVRRPRRDARGGGRARRAGSRRRRRPRPRRRCRATRHDSPSATSMQVGQRRAAGSAGPRCAGRGARSSDGRTCATAASAAPSSPRSAVPQTRIRRSAPRASCRPSPTLDRSRKWVAHEMHGS